MKTIASIFALLSALVVASTVLAADTTSQPLTRADCDKAGMRWNEGANVCTESTSTAAQAEARFAANTSSQPLTRADCSKAGMRWDEEANVCTESTAVQAETKPESVPGGKSPSVLITIDKTKQKMTVLIDGPVSATCVFFKPLFPTSV